MAANNYRVVETENGFAVFKVYYDALGNPIGKDASPVMEFFSSSPCGLLDHIESIQLAFEKNPIKISDIK